MTSVKKMNVRILRKQLVSMNLSTRVTLSKPIKAQPQLSTTVANRSCVSAQLSILYLSFLILKRQIEVAYYNLSIPMGCTFIYLYIASTIQLQFRSISQDRPRARFNFSLLSLGGSNRSYMLGQFISRKLWSSFIERVFCKWLIVDAETFVLFIVDDIFKISF